MPSMNVDTSVSVEDAVMVTVLEEVRKERRAEDSDEEGVKEDAAVRAWARKDDAMAKRIGNAGAAVLL